MCCCTGSLRCSGLEVFGCWAEHGVSGSKGEGYVLDGVCVRVCGEQFDGATAHLIKLPIDRGQSANPELKPTTADIRTAQRQAEPCWRSARVHPLFRLGTEQLVQQKVSFPNGGPQQTPGVIVMHIDDTVGPNIDPALKGLVVVFNASDEATTQTVADTAGRRYSLHSEQANGPNRIVKTSVHDKRTGRFTVPARTVAVFAQQ
jgi:hypothetical protein